MRILFILDSVENPTSANVLMAQRLAGVLCAAGHTVHLLELWDGLHPQPELPGCTVHCLAFADERLMNAALENGRNGGSPIPVRLARLCCHPTAVAAAFRQLVLRAPRRVVDTRGELEKLDAAFHFEVICAVCAPYRAAFALETAQVQAKKAIWQLDPYASNRDYQAPGGYPRELELLNHLAAAFITRQAVGDYAPGAPLAAAAEKVLHRLLKYLALHDLARTEVHRPLRPENLGREDVFNRALVIKLYQCFQRKLPPCGCF